MRQALELERLRRDLTSAKVQLAEMQQARDEVQLELRAEREKHGRRSGIFG